MARITPSKGSKPDKLMRDAILLALHRLTENAEGKKTKRANIIADKLVGLATDGDMEAIKEVNNRVDGKSVQPLSGDSENPIQVALIERRVINPSNRNS